MQSQTKLNHSNKRNPHLVLNILIRLAFFTCFSCHNSVTFSCNIFFIFFIKTCSSHSIWFVVLLQKNSKMMQQMPPFNWDGAERLRQKAWVNKEASLGHLNCDTRTEHIWIWNVVWRVVSLMHSNALETKAGRIISCLVQISQITQRVVAQRKLSTYKFNVSGY